jgi:beta-1,4-N-acetylglucosaminyltransferase
MKICIVCSCGGHLSEVREFSPAYQSYSHFYVINKKIAIPAGITQKVYFIRHSERDWLFFANLWEAFKILRSERPDVILSTGAGPAVPFAIIGRTIFGVKVLFVETLTRIHAPSLTGRIMYWMSDRFLYQSEGLRAFFPKGQYGGSLL